MIRIIILSLMCFNGLNLVTAQSPNTGGKKGDSSWITVHGSFVSENQASDETYLDQLVPRTYSRNHLDVQLELFGAPFNLGYYYTTEANSKLNPISTYSISFDYNKFYANLRQKMDARIRAEKDSRLQHAVRIDINALNKEYGKLIAQISSPDYKALLDKNRKILARGMNDSAFRLTYRYRKASHQLGKYDMQIARLKEIEDLKKAYERARQLANMGTGLEQLNTFSPGGFRKGLKQYNLSKPGTAFLLDLKRLDFGTFDPRYNSLVLGGVSLTGVNIEVNPWYAYGAFAWGSTVSNFTNPFSRDVAGSRTITAGRVGVGRTEKLLVAVTILKGQDASSNIVQDTNAVYYVPRDNYVLGTDITYKGELVEAGVEYARTMNTDRGTGSEGTLQQFGETVDVNSRTRSSAWSAFARGTLNDWNTRLELLTRVVDPYFYSFGTPYLRRDNFRVEAKIQQPFWKNRLTAGLTYRRDQDNVYGHKQGTTNNNMVMLSAQLRVPRYPFLIVTWSPNFVSFFNAASGTQQSATFNLYSVTCGYVLQGSATVASTTGTYMKQLNTSDVPGAILYHTDQYVLTEMLLFKNLDLTTEASGTYVQPYVAGDSSGAVRGSLSVSKGFFKRRLTPRAGYAYQKDYAYEERHIAEAGCSISFGWNISCDLHYERHFITPASASATRRDMNLGRLTLIKTF